MLKWVGEIAFLYSILTMESNQKVIFIFNIILSLAELGVIFLLGILLSVPNNVNILILVSFSTVKLVFIKSGKHYKKWLQCIIWSLLTFLSLYLLSDLDLFAIFLLTVFTAVITTNYANIPEILQWKKVSESKYQDVIEFIKYNSFFDELIEFENKLKNNDNLSYLLYKYRFKENKTFSEISDLLDIETNRITEYLDKIAFAIRIYCKI